MEVNYLDLVGEGYMGSTVVGKYNVEAIKVKLKLFLWFIKHLEMKYGRTKVQLHALLTSARNRNVKQKPGSLQPKARGSGTPLTAGWVGPTAGLETVLKRKQRCSCQETNPGRPVCSQPHY